jgi:23S rRNA (cytosine1962-C5)-methyltransferase
MREQDPSLGISTAYRLFNGFYEGLPGLVVDRYANTIVISNHSRQPENLNSEIDQIARLISTDIPGIESVLLKVRHAIDPEKRKGRLLFGERLPQEISEYSVRYALNLRLHQDDSFYLDTRNLRSWLIQNSRGKSVLNTFAYTGSLGIAALAGGAALVLQTDTNKEFLALAEKSRQLNQLPDSMRLWNSDFFKAAARLKQAKSLFDILILDAPFFSQSRFGAVDLQKESVSLINKARPLVAHEGRLVVINNSLFVPGSQVIDEINELSQSGYISLEQIIEIPHDITGYPETIRSAPPTKPEPFNHPTKIAILIITRKDKAV